MAQKSAERVVADGEVPGQVKGLETEAQRPVSSGFARMRRDEPAGREAGPAVEGPSLWDRIMTKVAGNDRLWNVMQGLIVAAPPLGAAVAAVAYGIVGIAYLIGRAGSRP